MKQNGPTLALRYKRVVLYIINSRTFRNMIVTDNV